MKKGESDKNNIKWFGYKNRVQLRMELNSASIKDRSVLSRDYNFEGLIISYEKIKYRQLEVNILHFIWTDFWQRSSLLRILSLDRIKSKLSEFSLYFMIQHLMKKLHYVWEENTANSQCNELLYRTLDYSENNSSPELTSIYRLRMLISKACCHSRNRNQILYCSRE